MSRTGIVSLVGAGPGDPGLMTLKGLERLKQADVVIYDYLANPHFLKILPSKVLKIYAGKKGSSHSREQDEINDLLVAHARKGRNVVRLKGGDPFLFGRGGEEAEALAAAGVPFEIVPGVTSAIGVPAYAGIPVTHRDFTSSVAFVTGHDQTPSERRKNSGFPPDWKALAKMGTIVFLMGYSNTPKIARHLMRAGRSPQTPVAVIQWGTYSRQKKVVGTLATIAKDLKKSKIGPPTVIVIGEVVSLSKSLSWYGLPLSGKTILVTRSHSQASDLARLLRERGARVLECPTIEIEPPPSWKELDEKLKRLRDYDDLIFTSVNAVRFFFERFRKRPKRAALKSLRIAAVGSSTAQALSAFGVKAHVVAKEFNASSLLKALRSLSLAGRRVLFPRAKEGRETLVKGLKASGALVDMVEAYRSRVPDWGPEMSEVLGDKNIDLVTFASSQTVKNFVSMLENRPRILSKFRDRIPAVVIGPVTARTAQELGFKKTLQPRRATIENLAACCALSI